MRKVLIVLLLCLGILLLFYPAIGKLINKFNQTNVVIKYKQELDEMKEEDIEKQKENYNKYNEDLLLNKANSIDLLNIGGVIGYIEVPKIKVFLPIYEGTNEQTLLQGIGHLENTSLPARVTSYHSVLVGHTGITAKILFDDLINLQLGDEFSVTILDEIYNYKICNIKKVLPNETGDLKIKQNKKLVTLVTCTPKYVNSHRLLVIGEEK